MRSGSTRTRSRTSRSSRKQPEPGVPAACELLRTGWSSPTTQCELDRDSARTEAALASGKLSATATATIAGIAQRNLEKVRDSPALPQSAVAAREAFYDWLCEVAAEAMGSDPAEVAATVDAIESMNRMLIVRANAEPGMRHRTAIHAWFSGREESAAGDVLPWAQEIVLGLLGEHGTLAAWHAAYLAEQAHLAQERHDALEAQLERNRLAAAERATRRPDPETRPE
jgi:hypothetical protein